MKNTYKTALKVVLWVCSLHVRGLLFAGVEPGQVRDKIRWADAPVRYLVQKTLAAA